MKNILIVVILICACLSLAACGSVPKIASATAAPVTAAPASAAPVAEVAAAAEQVSGNGDFDAAKLEAYVARCNQEESAKRSPDDPLQARYKVGEGNTIVYMFTMDAIETFCILAKSGEQGALDVYNEIMGMLPDIQLTVEEDAQKEIPGVKVILRLSTDTEFNRTLAEARDGVVTFDSVNNIGTAPADDVALPLLSDLPPEVREALGLTN